MSLKSRSVWASDSGTSLLLSLKRLACPKNEAECVRSLGRTQPLSLKIDLHPGFLANFGSWRIEEGSGRGKWYGHKRRGESEQKFPVGLYGTPVSVRAKIGSISTPPGVSSKGVGEKLRREPGKQAFAPKFSVPLCEK